MTNTTTITSAKTISTSALAAALIAIGAFIKIPMPFGLSMTLQVFFVVLAGFLLGKPSTMSALAYMVIGLVGVPVFTEGGGLMYVLKPSFGYIIAFIPACYMLSVFTKNENCSFMRYMVAGIITVLFIYLIGISYFSIVYKFYLGKAVTGRLIFMSLFLSLIWKDVLSVIIASLIAVRIRRLVRPQTKN